MKKKEEVKVEYYDNGNKKRETHYKDGKEKMVLQLTGMKMEPSRRKYITKMEYQVSKLGGIKMEPRRRVLILTGMKMEPRAGNHITKMED